jgi:CHAD domain-containing protein
MNTVHQAPPLHQHLDASLKVLWKRYRKRLRRCREQCSEERVHDLRVEVRRLLSLAAVSGLFVSKRRQEKKSRLLKAHLEQFAELRDLQVQHLRLRSLATRFPAARLYRKYLAKREEGCLRATAKGLRRFRSSRLKKLIGRLRRDIRLRHRQGWETCDVRRLRRELRQTFDRVERLRAKIEAEQPKTIHRTRIAFKKYRYLMETLAPLLPGVAPSQLQAMHDFQTLMGDIQDLEVLRAGFEAFRCEQTLPAEACRAFGAELERRGHRALERFLAQAGRLQTFTPAAAWETKTPGT